MIRSRVHFGMLSNSFRCKRNGVDEMGDEAEYKVKYLDGDEEEELMWIARAGKALVTYVNGCTYEGDNAVMITFEMKNSVLIMDCP